MIKNYTNLEIDINGKSVNVKINKDDNSLVLWSYPYIFQLDKLLEEGYSHPRDNNKVLMHTKSTGIYNILDNGKYIFYTKHRY